jgi:hypothetical protein
VSHHPIAGPAEGLLRACALVKHCRGHDAEAFGVLLGESVTDSSDAAHLIMALIRLVGRISEENDLDLDEWLRRALPALAVCAAEQEQPE